MIAFIEANRAHNPISADCAIAREWARIHVCESRIQRLRYEALTKFEEVS